jgi:hypothetical protein
MKRRSVQIADDARGSILLPALAAVAVLVLGVSYIAQTAQDVLGRIAVQTQADSAALEGAIWHAQGMNLLVTLNIVMACIFACFVAIRLAVLGLAALLAIVVIGSALASLVSFGTAAAAGAHFAQVLGRALHQMHSIERRVAKPVMNALKVTSSAERVVSAAVPWVAAALPVSRLSGNGGALVFSVSMLPNILEQKLETVGPTLRADRPVVGGMKPRTQFPPRMGNLAGLGSSDKPPAGTQGRHSRSTVISRVISKASAKGRKVSNSAGGASNSTAARVVDALSGSLPAQDEDIFMVCSRSAQLVSALVTKVLLGPLRLDASAVDSFNSAFGKTIGSISTVACTPMDELDDKVQDQITSQVSAKCQEEKEKWQSTPQEGRGAQHRRKPWTKGQQLACEEEQKKKAAEAVGKGQGPGKSDVDPTKDQASSEDIKTASLWSLILSPNTSPLLHVWSVNLTPSWPHFPGDAEAEFLHVCTGNFDKDGRSCGDNSLWRYGWYAKNVPLRPLEQEFAAHMGDMFEGFMGNAAGKAIQGIIGRLAAFLPAGFNQKGGPLGPVEPPRGKHSIPSGGKHRAPNTQTVQDVLMRNLSGLRHPELGNGYWNRKVVAPLLGTQIRTDVQDIGSRVFH